MEHTDKATPRPWNVEGVNVRSEIASLVVRPMQGYFSCGLEEEATANAELIVRAVNGMSGSLWECVSAFLEINGYRYPVESKNHSALSYYVSQIEKCVLEDSANFTKAEGK